MSTSSSFIAYHANMSYESSLAGASLRKVNEHVFVAGTPNRIVIMPLRTGKPVVLAETAKIIWDELDGVTDFSEVVNQLCITFESEFDQLRSPVEDFIWTLIQQGLVEIVQI